MDHQIIVHTGKICMMHQDIPLYGTSNVMSMSSRRPGRKEFVDQGDFHAEGDSKPLLILGVLAYLL